MKKFLPLFLAFIFISSLNAQMKITSATFGAMEARHLGPGSTSGRITSICGDSSGKVIYIGAGGGGIWKTTTAGVSFKSIFDKNCQSIGAIALDQKHPDVIYAGTRENKIHNQD